LYASIDGVVQRKTKAILLATAGMCNPKFEGLKWPGYWSFVARRVWPAGQNQNFIKRKI